jgi:hypothetical protein
MSEDDIEKGQRWSAEIAGQLSQSKMGIICVTPENVSSPWLNFEAGAISKTVGDAFVAPLLLGLRKADLPLPLGQFQATTTAKSDIRRLLETINKAIAASGEKAYGDAYLGRAFERAWRDLEVALNQIPPAVAPAPERAPGEILNEILETVRQLARPSRVAEHIRLGDVTATDAALQAILGRRDVRLAAEGPTNAAFVKALMQREKDLVRPDTMAQDQPITAPPAATPTPTKKKPGEQ